MRHERHYSVEQARAARGWVHERLEIMREARQQLSDEEVRDALSEAAPTNGGGEPGRHVSEAFLALRRGLLELQSVEVVVRDLDRGLVDFPAIIDGEEVYLCWVDTEEDDIEFWHGLDDGYPGRQEL